MNSTFNFQSEISDEVKQFLKSQYPYAAAIKEVITKLEVLDEEFNALHEYNPIHNIESRLKSPQSIAKKLKEHNFSYAEDNIQDIIRDIAGIRVVCKYIEDTYKLADLLLKQRDIVLIECQDYIENPKESGYRGLHLLIEIPVFLSVGVKSIPVEVQIRTLAMDLWASLEHHLRYKSVAPVSDDISDRLMECAEKISDIDRELQDILHAVEDSE